MLPTSIRAAAVVLAGLLTAGIGRAATLAIDTFDDGPLSTTLNVPAGQNTGVQNDGTATPGGWRIVTVNNNSGVGPATATRQNGQLLGSGTMPYIGIWYGFRLAGFGAATTGFSVDQLNLDLSGIDGFQLDFGAVTGSVDVYIELISGGARLDAPLDPATQVSPNITSAGILTVPLSSFGLRNGPFNLSDVDFMFFMIRPMTPGSTFALNSISAVPEPGTWTLLIGGVAAIAMARRRACGRRGRGPAKALRV